MPKKPSININGGPLAAGFFSQETIKKSEDEIPVSALVKNEVTSGKSKFSVASKKGGRPKKNGLKAEQYSLTMEPEKYEKLRLISKKYTKGNFSSLIDLAVTQFCDKNGIDLDTIHIDEEVLDSYRKKQSRRNK